MMRCNMVYIFAIMTCIYTFLFGTETAYRQAVFTTLEKRFHYKTTILGFIYSCYDIGYIFGTIVFGAIGHKFKKVPRLIQACGYGLCLSSFLFFLPHIIFGAEELPNDSIGNSTHEFGYNNRIHLCDSPSKVTISNLISNKTSNSNNHLEECKDNSLNGNQLEQGITGFFLVFAKIAIGFNLVAMLNVSISYIDKLLRQQGTSIYIACIWSSGFFGYTAGYLLGALYTSYYIDLSDVNLDQDDPAWVGAWWLGSVTICCVCFIHSALYFLIPSQIPILNNTDEDKAYELKHTETELTNINALSYGNDEEKERKLRSTDEKEKMIEPEVDNEDDDHANAKEMGLKADDEGNADKEFKVLSNVKQLLQNPVLMGLVIGNCSPVWVYGMYGTTFLPKYLETQFQMTASMANIFAAIMAGAGCTTGMILSGVIQLKFKLTMRQMILLTIGGALTSLIIVLLVIALSCDLKPLAGTVVDGSLDVNMECMSHCSCELNLLPICVDGHTNYASACHAGCMDTNLVDGVQMYNNCSCLPNNSTVVDGWCKSDCVPMVATYIVLCFILLMTVCGTNVVFPTTCVLLLVDSKQSNLALGILMVFTCMLGWFPGPVVYGSVIDSTCLLWDVKCGQRGNCLVYDVTQYNYRYNILTALLQLTAIAANSFAYYKWQKGARDSNDKINETNA
ncbi:unnamed protein product [Owenia fusiformis]|uniref:Solute carrier organic anion transporter family member n=1 Tax=Owenia fusiformis TaxID=6347 RepID=A0A8J1XZ84_OWEFU|nr:unnamed protein product [Owenia fusiformis]